jgi:hypothetical protein
MVSGSRISPTSGSSRSAARRSIARRAGAGGNPSSSNRGFVDGMARMTPRIVPRARNMLTRKRPSVPVHDLGGDDAEVGLRLEPPVDAQDGRHVRLEVHVGRATLDARDQPRVELHRASYLIDTGGRKPSTSRILASRSANTTGFSCSQRLAFSRP